MNFAHGETLGPKAFRLHGADPIPEGLVAHEVTLELRNVTPGFLATLIQKDPVFVSILPAPAAPALSGEQIAEAQRANAALAPVEEEVADDFVVVAPDAVPTIESGSMTLDAFGQSLRENLQEPATDTPAVQAPGDATPPAPATA